MNKRVECEPTLHARSGISEIISYVGMRKLVHCEGDHQDDEASDEVSRS